MLTRSDFADSFRELCDLYGRKYNQEQCDSYWRIISEKKWGKIRFDQVMRFIRESETTFPSAAKLIMANRDLPDPSQMMSREEAEALWDSIPECGDCSDGIVYLVPKGKGSRLMGSCSVCDKGRLRQRKNSIWTPLHPISLNTPVGKSFSLTHKLDPIAHAKWKDITLSEVKTLRQLLPKGGSLDREYIGFIKKNRPDLFELLIKEDSK